MAKIYFLRHQAGGVITKYPFAQQPTKPQVEAVARECFQTFGGKHPKTDEEYWLRVEERDVIGPDDEIAVPERVLASTVSEITAKGTAHVKPRG